MAIRAKAERTSTKTNGVTRVAVDPVCVEFQDDEGDQSQTGWCLADGGPDKDFTQQHTVCHKYVVFPGSYKRRQPTCPDCLSFLTEGKSLKSIPHAAKLLS